MNEESTVPEIAATVAADEIFTEGTIYEDLTGAPTEETSGTISVQVIESIGSDIIHADLFGSFLICGTLVGLALLRKIHGT